MKSKKSGKKLRLLVKKIASLVRKGNKSQSDQATKKVKMLQTELETTLGLSQEIKALKSTLKNRKKDLADGVSRLEKKGKKTEKELKDKRKIETREKKTSKKSVKKDVAHSEKMKKPKKIQKVKGEAKVSVKAKRDITKVKPENT